MIYSEKDLTQFIRTQLGEPVITVELADEQIISIIKQVIQEYKTQVDPPEDNIVLNFRGKGTYRMPGAITAIKDLKISDGMLAGQFQQNYGTNAIPDLWSQQFFNWGASGFGGITQAIVQISAATATINKWLGRSLVYYFNQPKAELKLMENFEGPAIMWYYYEYVPNICCDAVYNTLWIKNMSLQRCKLLWGSILSKYDNTLAGGKANGERIIQEATDAIQKLNEDLINDWTDPCPIFVG